MKFTIDRSKWRFGGHNYDRALGPTSLLNSTNGTMCCLGQISLQCGLSETDIKDKAGFMAVTTPNSDFFVPGHPYRILVDDVGFPNELSNFAMEINDMRQSPSGDNFEREKELAALFKEYGHELEFVGTYHPAYKV